MTDRSLIEALESLPIRFPEPPSIDFSALRRPVSRLRWAPAIAALSILLVLGFMAPVREAVADWLGIGVVRIELVDELPDGLGEQLDLGARVGVHDAPEAEAVWPVELGDPQGAYRRDGSLSFVWAPRAGLPEVGSTGVGALLTRFEGAVDPGVVKSIGPDAILQAVTVDGSAAYWIEGAPHSFTYVDRTGNPITETARLAGNTLLWEEDGSTWRFESSLDLDRVLELVEGR